MKLYTQHLSPYVSERDDAAVLVEMNTTPLIDVLLVLIVMLIITIPGALHSVNLDMPSRQESNVVPEVIVLQIDAKGFVLWDGVKLSTMNDVNTQINSAARQAVQPEVHLQPAPDVPYAFVTAVLVMAKKAGLKKVGVTQ